MGEGGQGGWGGLGAPLGAHWLCGGIFSPSPPGPLMQVLVTIIAPIYWSLAHAGGGARSGFLLTQGTFQHESQLEFATGEGCQGALGAADPGPAWLSFHLPHTPELHSQR